MNGEPNREPGRGGDSVQTVRGKPMQAIKKGECFIRIEEAKHNHPAVAPETFTANQKNSQADIAIIKDDNSAHLSSYQESCPTSQSQSWQ